MKHLRNLSIIGSLLFCLQPARVHAQLGSLLNIGAHVGLDIAGAHMSKQEKIIDRSSKQEKINGSNITELRVKESEIKSKAKKNIIALQNRLDLYAIQYKNKEIIDIPKNDSDLIAIQNIDENWPSEYYGSELRAYKRYVYQLKLKTPAAPLKSLQAPPANPAKNDTTNQKKG